MFGPVRSSIEYGIGTLYENQLYHTTGIGLWLHQDITLLSPTHLSPPFSIFSLTLDAGHRTSS